MRIAKSPWFRALPYCLRLALLVLALSAPVLIGCSTGSSMPAAPDVTAVEDIEKEDLEKAKLAEEARSIRLQTDRQASPWTQLLAWAPFVTAGIAVLGVGLTVWKQFAERAAEREEKTREQQRRFDEAFAKTV